MKHKKGNSLKIREFKKFMEISKYATKGRHYALTAPYSYTTTRFASAGGEPCGESPGPEGPLPRTVAPGNPAVKVGQQGPHNHWVYLFGTRFSVRA